MTERNLRSRKRRDRANIEVSSSPARPKKNHDSEENPGKSTTVNRILPSSKDNGATSWWHRRRYFWSFGVLVGFFSAMMVYPHVPDARLDIIAMKNISIPFKEFFEKQIQLENLYSSIDFQKYTSSPEVRPSFNIIAETTGLSAVNYPVIMIPGFTSTGLEVWDHKTCAEDHFRQRIWGTFRMLHQFTLNHKCWLEHIRMDPFTGLDPEGIKLRPAQGLEAADFVFAYYWVWGKIIENLADVGYTSNNMFMQAYDWRLSPALLQKRDFYFTKLLSTIETARTTNDQKKVVILSHSYGAQLFLYFCRWVQSPEGGGKGLDWVDQNVHAFVDIAGPFLGIPKTIATLLSGEMKETAELGVLSHTLEYLFGPSTRARLARTWSSVMSMGPMGGAGVWGTLTSAPDDFPSRTYPLPLKPNEQDKDKNKDKAAMSLSHEQDQSVQSGLLIEKERGGDGSIGTRIKSSMESSMESPSLDSAVSHAEAFESNGPIIRFLDKSNHNITGENYEHILEAAHESLRQAMALKKDNEWMDPLRTPLPHAPNLSIYCLYGVGIASERAYYYRKRSPQYSGSDIEPEAVPFLMERDFHAKPFIRAGVRYTDGDGSVPLISLGYMCAKGWKSEKLNPGGAKVVTLEHLHQPVPLLEDSRGGPSTSDHVDIMGNTEVIETVLRVCMGFEGSVKKRILSDIDAISERVTLETDGGKL